MVPVWREGENVNLKGENIQLKVPALEVLFQRYRAHDPVSGVMTTAQPTKPDKLPWLNV